MTREPGAGPRRPSGMRRSARLVPLCFILLAACSAAPGASNPASLPAAPGSAASEAPPSARPSLSPVSPGPTQVGVGIRYSGVLAMDDIEGGCPYLQSASGRLQILYPEGWTLKESPLQLIAPDGSVHSRAGDVVSVLGTEAGDMASICQIGPIIRATDVLGR